MRTKNKITREQHRVKKAQKQESKVLYFAQDPQVSSRILAVLHVGATKSAVPLYEKKQGTKDIIRIALNSKNPIDIAITWRNTKQGHEYWRKINDLVINELSK